MTHGSGVAWDMWGEDWGSMIWGVRAVPALRTASVVLGIAALGLAFMAMRRRRRVTETLVVAASALGVFASPPAVGDPIALPHTFSNATPANADEVNANFDALVAESNAKDARLDALSNGRTIALSNCAFTPCTDAPNAALCPAGQIMVGVDLPEFGGNEGSCNLDPTTGPDDFRIQCCEVGWSTP